MRAPYMMRMKRSLPSWSVCRTGAPSWGRRSCWQDPCQNRYTGRTSAEHEATPIAEDHDEAEIASGVAPEALPNILPVGRGRADDRLRGRRRRQALRRTSRRPARGTLRGDGFGDARPPGSGSKAGLKLNSHRPSSLLAGQLHARVDHGQQDVHDQLQTTTNTPEKKIVMPMIIVVIAVGDRLTKLPPDAGDGKQPLHDEGAGQKPATSGPRGR